MFLLNKEVVLAPARMDITAECLTKSLTSANKKANLCVYALVRSMPCLGNGAADKR